MSAFLSTLSLSNWLFAAVFAATIIAELLVQPRSGGRPKVLGSILTVAFLAIIVFLLTGRPVTSTVTSIALLMSLTIVSNVKYAVLKEPLLAVDFAVVERLVRHPQFFVPYLGTLPAILISALLLGALIVALTFEEPAHGALGEARWRVVIAIALIGALFIGYRAFRSRLVAHLERLNPSFDAVLDTGRFGLFGNLLLTAVLLVGGYPNRAHPPNCAKLWPHSSSG